MPLDDDARGDPLADQLEQPTGVVEVERVHRRRLAEAADLDHVQGLGVEVPVGARNLLPRDPLGQVERVAGAADEVLAGRVADRRPGEQALPRADGKLRPVRDEPHAPPPTIFSRSMRRCCSSAASSPNILL
ncbi:hypothetical protein GCM10022237_36190 [Nocardioides ginsengisoli]